MSATLILMLAWLGVDAVAAIVRSRRRRAHRVDVRSIYLANDPDFIDELAAAVRRSLLRDAKRNTL